MSSNTNFQDNLPVISDVAEIVETMWNVIV